MGAHVGCSDYLVCVAFRSDKEHAFGDCSDPPGVQREVGIAPVDALSVVELRGRDLAYVLLVAQHD